MTDPTTLGEWITFVVDQIRQLLSAWPFVGLVALVVLARSRAQLADGARALAAILDRGGRVAAGPISLETRAPVPAIDAADESAAVSLAEDPVIREQAEGLRERLEQIRSLRDEVDDAWGAEPLRTAEARATRLATRARAILEGLSDRVEAITFSIRDWEDPHDAYLVEDVGTFKGSRGAIALLRLAWSSTWSAGVENATYLEYVHAATLMKEAGTDTSVPPFDNWHLEWARKANSTGYSHRRA